MCIHQEPCQSAAWNFQLRPAHKLTALVYTISTTRRLAETVACRISVETSEGRELHRLACLQNACIFWDQGIDEVSQSVVSLVPIEAAPAGLRVALVPVLPVRVL